jgi:hypothetical protein
MGMCEDCDFGCVDGICLEELRKRQTPQPKADPWEEALEVIERASRRENQTR